MFGPSRGKTRSELGEVRAVKEFLLAAACGLLLAADNTKEQQAMGDQEKIQGSWVLASGERDGKPLPDQAIQDIKLIFSGDKLTTQHKDRKTEATFKLDAQKTPKQIDLDLGGRVGKGIYQLDGDNLKIVHGVLGDDRPTDFPNAGSGLTVLVLKRQKS
jgi:uncharacterized protein (TIGR03067 family)